jgi:hypothetical protein
MPTASVNARAEETFAARDRMGRMDAFMNPVLEAFGIQDA